MKLKSPLFYVLVTTLFIGFILGGIKLYYVATDGFSLRQINSTLTYDPRWAVSSLSAKEQANLDEALAQTYRYLGKGCQSYVFSSADDKYVIKFFKHQHFRTQKWIDLFTFLPFVKNYQLNNQIVKKQKLEKLFVGCKISFEHLKNETGMIYVHLNKSPDWNKKLIIIDKLGLKHEINLGEMEFILQYKAKMLREHINELMAQDSYDEAALLIDKLLVMLISEYENGIADNDHALMQNSGVLNNRPIHIDVGQFIQNDILKKRNFYKKELFDKTYIFNEWLKKHHPKLSDHLSNRLLAIVGIDFFYFPPYKHREDCEKPLHTGL